MNRLLTSAAVVAGTFLFTFVSISSTAGISWGRIESAEGAFLQPEQSEFGANRALPPMPEAANAGGDSILIQVMIVEGEGGTPRLAANRAVEILLAEGNIFTPIDPNALLMTDENGVVDAGSIIPSRGSPFVVRLPQGAFPAFRPEHEAVDDVAYTIVLDNLGIEPDGSITPDVIEADRDTTLVYANHYSMGYNFTVSIEWPASDEYVTSLENALRKASNLLYDVSNGQMYLSEVAIYDDKDRWGSADIRVLASNKAWPHSGLEGFLRPERSPISLPAVIYGPEVSYPLSSGHPSRVHSFLASFVDTSLDADRVPMAQALVHEFGHYVLRLLDEHQDALGRLVHPDVNFGIMDDAFGLGSAASEFSGFVTPEYRDTEQFEKWRMSSWEGIALSHLKSPQDFGLQHPEFVSGPNEDLMQPDADVGAAMKIYRFTTGESIPQREVRVLNAAGEPVGYEARVYLRRTDGLEIDQGQAASSLDAAAAGVEQGAARILGGRTGDTVVVFGSGAGGLSPEYGSTIIPSDDIDSDDPLVVEMRYVLAGSNLYCSLDASDTGELLFQAITAAELLPRPAVEFADEAGEILALGRQDDNLGYVVSLSSLPESDFMWLNLVDPGGVPFSVPLEIDLVEVDTAAYASPSFGLIRLYRKPGMTADEVAIMRSPLPMEASGLPPSMRRVSQLVSLQGFPPDATVDMKLQMDFDGDSLLASTSDAATVYRRTADGWDPRPTKVNTQFQTATADIVASGTYAVFLDVTKATAVAAEGAELPQKPATDVIAFPNPFGSRTAVAFEMPEPGRVTLTVYNILGQPVSRRVDEFYPAGKHQISLELDTLPPGHYVARLSLINEVRTVVLIKAG